MHFPASVTRSFAVLALVLASACGGDSTTAPTSPSDPATETFAASLGVNLAQMTRKSADLYIQDITVGTGTEATNNRLLRVTYTGWLVNGTRFDTNVGAPTFPFILGQRQVIAGWDQGVLGMRVGGKRRLVIGSNLGYGPSGSGPIGPHATLVFEVELVSVQ